MRKHQFALALLALAGLISPARAGITYSYVADQSSYQATAGGTVTVNLYLQETLTSGSSSLVTANGGLFGAGLQVNQTGGSGSTITGIASVNATPFGSGAFTSSQVNGGGTGAQIALSVNTASTGAAWTTTSSTVNQFLIGSITITAGSSPGTTTYTLAKYPPTTGGGVTTTFGGNNSNGFDLDYTNNNGPTVRPTGGATYVGTTDTASGANPAFTFTVSVGSAVPEPSSMLLCGFAFSGMGLGAYRRYKARQKAKAEQTAEAPAAV